MIKKMLHFSIRAVRPNQTCGWTNYASKAYFESLDKSCFRSLHDKNIGDCVRQSHPNKVGGSN